MVRDVGHVAVHELDEAPRHWGLGWFSAGSHASIGSLALGSSMDHVKRQVKAWSARADCWYSNCSHNWTNLATSARSYSTICRSGGVAPAGALGEPKAASDYPVGGELGLWDWERRC